jgi:cyclophilin family peptidyl-prolyl cis-trans isomerase
LTDGLKLQHVWAKDAAGLVSAEALRGPCSAAGLAASEAASESTVCMMTSLGEMVFELAPTEAPLTTANFLSYVNSGFYTGTVFHRVIGDFMVQGGGFDEALTRKSTAEPIALEAAGSTGLSNTSGTIAMARTQVLNSATSQFFVNVVDNTFLDTSGGGYAVFGALISGQATLEAIRQLETNARSGLDDVPVNLPVIQWAVQLR